MVFKFIALLTILHLVLSLPDPGVNFELNINAGGNVNVDSYINAPEDASDDDSPPPLSVLLPTTTSISTTSDLSTMMDFNSTPDKTSCPSCPTVPACPTIATSTCTPCTTQAITTTTDKTSCPSCPTVPACPTIATSTCTPCTTQAITTTTDNTTCPSCPTVPACPTIATSTCIPCTTQAITTTEECPESLGYTKLQDSGRCLKLFTDIDRDWYQSMTKCRDERMFMVKTTPADAVSIRAALVRQFGNAGSYAWLDARYDGAQYVWNDGGVIAKDNPLWRSTQLKPGYCLLLLNSQYYIDDQPLKPYATWPCASTENGRKAFCEWCPESLGFTMFEGSNRCFKLFTDIDRDWYQSMTKCREEGMIMAKISDEDAVIIRDSLVKKYGYSGSYAWLDAKYDGAQFVWSDGEVIADNNPLWYPYDLQLKPHNCLLLLNGQNYIDQQPLKPYYGTSCTSLKNIRKAFCELI